jgi:hypothetical protein
MKQLPSAGHCRPQDLLVATSLLALLVVCVMGYLTADDSNGGLEEVGVTRMGRLSAVLNYRVQINNQVRRFYEANSKSSFPYEQQITELQGALASKRAADQALVQAFNEYDQVPKTPEGQQIWDGLKTYWQPWHDAIVAGVTRKLEDALQNPTPEKLLAFYQVTDEIAMQQRNNTREITTRLGELADRTQMLTEEYVKETLARGDKFIAAQLTVSAIAIALLVILGITTLKTIVRPLELIRDTVLTVLFPASRRVPSQGKGMSTILKSCLPQSGDFWLSCNMTSGALYSGRFWRSAGGLGYPFAGQAVCRRRCCVIPVGSFQFEGKIS